MLGLLPLSLLLPSLLLLRLNLLFAYKKAKLVKFRPRSRNTQFTTKLEKKLTAIRITSSLRIHLDSTLNEGSKVLKQVGCRSRQEADSRWGRKELFNFSRRLSFQLLHWIPILYLQSLVEKIEALIKFIAPPSHTHCLSILRNRIF